jgi:protein SCO1
MAALRARALIRCRSFSSTTDENLRHRLSSLRPVNPRIVVALFLVGVLALGAVVLAAGGDESDEAPPNTFEGSLMPKDVPAPDFRLENQDGETVSMRSLRGRPVVVTFLYTTCQDSCPIQAQTVRGALDELGHDVPALAIAVDPPRDTPERAQAFLAKQRATGRIDFVLGSRAELRPLWNDYGIRPQSVDEEHMARITLVDARGFQRIGYPGAEATPERLAHDLRLLEREPG